MTELNVCTSSYNVTIIALMMSILQTVALLYTYTDHFLDY